MYVTGRYGVFNKNTVQHFGSSDILNKDADPDLKDIPRRSAESDSVQASRG